jgi:hypothetical protein
MTASSPVKVTLPPVLNQLRGIHFPPLRNKGGLDRSDRYPFGVSNQLG